MSKHSISLLETWSGERSAELVATSETRNPKPTVKVGFELRNPKPETDSEDLTPQDGSKPETRNRLWRLNFPRANRNPKPEKTRNPKPETDSESWFQATKPETRNRQRKLVSINETRNPKPTRIRLLGGSPDRNSLNTNLWMICPAIKLWFYIVL